MPGADKVGLVEHATAGDAAALDRFGRALQDGGFMPLTFEATDVAWAQATPGNVVATIVVKAAEPASRRRLHLPMEFTPLRDLATDPADRGSAAGTGRGRPSPTPTR